ncbi:MAG: phage portal protein, partial [Actinomycetota bacterium]
MFRSLMTKLKAGVSAFDFGSRGRRMSAIPSVTVAINTLIRTYGRTVVARSRHLANNNPYAQSAKEVFVSALVGDGIKPSSLVEDPDDREALQEAWLESTDELDADGLTDYYGLQQLVASEMFEAGECFVRIRPRRVQDGLLVPMQLQLIPSEMLPYEHNVAPTARGNRVEMGIEFNGIGQRVAYHFLTNHPGDHHVIKVTSAHTVRVPASEVLHLFKPVRVGQTRGIPHTLSSLVSLAMLDMYD